MSSKSVDLGSEEVKLQIWDTAGQERFAPLAAPYYRKADGVIYVFDLACRSSLERVESHWHGEVEKQAPGVASILVGAKADLAAERLVAREEAQAVAERLQMVYVETSAKTGAHVRDAFSLLVCNVMNSRLEREGALPTDGLAATDKPTRLAPAPAQAEKQKCC